MTNYISTPLSTLNADLNAIQTTLSSKADKSEIPEVPEDLSSFTNSPGYATSAYVQEYVDEHGGASGDYLPLSGGTLSGRIYLKASQSQVVGSNAVLTDSESDTINVGSWDESVELTANVTLSVMNAGQDFIDMISNDEEYTGDELTSYTVNARIQFVGPNGFTKTLESSGTIGFGYSYVSDNSILFYDSLDADLGHEDESALVFNELVFNMGRSGSEASFVLRFTVDGGDPYDFPQVNFNYSDIWTVEEIREEVETIEPFVISSELPEVSAFATKAELNTKANESDLTALAHDVEDNYCTNQYASETFATKDELTAYATKTYVQEYVAEHGGGGGGGGDYLPLSGGNLSGRIYLKTTTGEQTIDTSMVVGYYSDEDCNAEISVYASEEYLRSGGGSAGASVNCSVKVYDKTDDVSSDVSIALSPDWSENPDTEEEEYYGTWQVSIGDGEEEDAWNITVTASPTADDGALIASIDWQSSGGIGASATSVPLSNPTADTTVETTTPFVTSADVDAVLGDINSILDSINGEII